ncbi:uncharacterized protein LOC141795095 [Halichoeres trimaculatus]|uniref:uncharacterized protein LOC141795095 n=1 Tax=Halichoeres trimaculatus TaxID=147232 RepID=UPI003D9F8E28
MFRFSLLIAVSLIVGLSAKPYKPWNKFTDETFQDTVMSMDKDGKLSWVEVEPPEDLDETHYDVDPSMKIWKSMTGGEGPQHMEAEVDLDELYHPSMADLLQVQIQNMDVVPDEEAPPKFEQPEEDLAHPRFELVQEEPEQEWDEDKAREVVAKYLAPFMVDYQKGAEVQPLYSEPEEDMDDVYHRDLPELVLHQDEAEPAAALVDLPSQRKYSEPEEDLDGIYHK